METGYYKFDFFFERCIVDQNTLNESYDLFVKTLFDKMDCYLKLP